MVSVSELVQTGLLLSIAYFVGRAIYNLLFHPLRRFPGPLSHRISALPRAWHHGSGRLPIVVHELHKRYGTVVRIAPDELAFCSPQAWRDIYGHKTGQPELPKHDIFYNIFGQSPRSILNADSREHGVLRRNLATSFSDRSMREQEPIIGSYIDLLMARLRAAVQKSSTQDMRQWYKWVIFDIIGDLSFGVDGGFGCLQKSQSHPWVKVFTLSLTYRARIRALALLGFQRPMAWFLKLGLLKDKRRDVVSEKVAQRLESPQRPDFLEGLISKQDELGLTHAHLAMTATVLVVAGSETTTTLLSGATYFLTAYPEVLKKLEVEVRGAFKSNADITFTSVSRLSYLLACLNESLRCYPPVPTGLPRVVPAGGVLIDGEFVPQNTVVSVFQWAVNHDERSWTEPDRFEPGRWLGDPKHKGDQLDAMQPFSVGPRNCLGKNLAYAEMRMILAKLIYNFDISMAKGHKKDWLRSQNPYETFWGDVPDLDIQLRPVVRETVNNDRNEEKDGDVGGH